MSSAVQGSEILASTSGVEAEAQYASGSFEFHSALSLWPCYIIEVRGIVSGSTSSSLDSARLDKYARVVSLVIKLTQTASAGQ